MIAWLKWTFAHHARRTCALIILLLAASSFQASAQVSGLTPPTSVPDALGDWLRVNAIAIVIMIFHFGVSWREFKDHRVQLAAHEKAINETIPERYVRNDVLAAKFDGLMRELQRMGR